MTPHSSFALQRQKDLANALNMQEDREKAERIFRTTLHTLRDYLSLDNSICLLRLLPHTLKTIYIENWYAPAATITLLSPQGFVKAVRKAAGKLAFYDFPTEAVTESYIRAVFRYVEKEMSTSKKRIFRFILPFSLILFCEPLSQPTPFTNIYKGNTSPSHLSKIV